MTILQQVPIAAIGANPFRRLGDYPYDERKLAALQKSIGAVGMWEGVIARQRGDRYQIAFGHHRLEAARRNGVEFVGLLVRDLTDEKMLAFMGAENAEDYRTDFFWLMTAWEAAVNFRSPGNAREIPQPIEIPRLLGCTVSHGRDGDACNDCARACSAAYALITDGHLTRDDLRDLSVRAARALAERVQTRIRQIQMMAEKTHRPADDVEKAVKQIAKAGKYTAKKVREGEIRQQEIAGSVDVESYRFAKEARAQAIDFEAFAKVAANSLEGMLNGDATYTRLKEIKRVLSDLNRTDDRLMVARLNFGLGELAERALKLQKDMVLPEAKLRSMAGCKADR